MMNIELINSDYLFESSRLNIKKDTVRLNNSSNDYIYVDKKNAVGIIAIVNDEIWLVEQYRHSVGQRLLEIPGGRVEKGEDPKNAAIRELKEETGLVALNIELFSTIYIHPSLCNEIAYIYLATEFINESQCLDKSEQDLDLKKVKIEELKELLLKNKILSAPDGYVLSLLMLNKSNKW